MYFKGAFLLCFIFQCSNIITASSPNIIVIIADDLGFNDLGYHGSDEIPTPNIDALSYNGVILNRHYVQPTCTPSRAALMTGKYPIRYGLQGPPIFSRSRVALPSSEKILPQFLKEVGYVTRLVGKWHLGFYKYEFTPTRRGFDSHFGYYNGWTRYNDTVTTSGNYWGYDARSNYSHAADRFRGKYATDVFTDEAVNIIKNHDTSKPLFLDISQIAVHALDRDVLQVRDPVENEKRFSYIKNPQRRLFAGVLTALDESVGKIITALGEKNMLKNSVVLMISDNGGATEGSRISKENSFKNTASNWPLRGWKSSLTEGGVRGAASIWSPLINANANSVSNQLIHVTDWLPTFYAAAGGDVSKLGHIDGINQWDYLTGKQETSGRYEALLNMNEKNNDTALIIEEWKYIRLSNSTPKEYKGDSGRDESYKYSIEEVLQSETHKILYKYSGHTSDPAKKFLQIRQQASIDSKCQERVDADDRTYTPYLPCFKTGCLFNIKNDPCEFTDLSENESDLMREFEAKLLVYRSELVPQQNFTNDPACDPSKFENYWTPWVQDKSYSSTSMIRITSSNKYILFIGGVFSLLMRYLHYSMHPTLFF